jgi:acetyl esterase/lipase
MGDSAGGNLCLGLARYLGELSERSQREEIKKIGQVGGMILYSVRRAVPLSTLLLTSYIAMVRYDLFRQIMHHQRRLCASSLVTSETNTDTSRVGLPVRVRRLWRALTRTTLSHAPGFAVLFPLASHFRRFPSVPSSQGRRDKGVHPDGHRGDLVR